MIFISLTPKKTDIHYLISTHCSNFTIYTKLFIQWYKVFIKIYIIIIKSYTDKINKTYERQIDKFILTKDQNRLNQDAILINKHTASNNVG